MVFLQVCCVATLMLCSAAQPAQWRIAREAPLVPPLSNIKRWGWTSGERQFASALQGSRNLQPDHRSVPLSYAFWSHVPPVASRALSLDAAFDSRAKEWSSIFQSPVFSTGFWNHPLAELNNWHFNNLWPAFSGIASVPLPSFGSWQINLNNPLVDHVQPEAVHTASFSSSSFSSSGSSSPSDHSEAQPIALPEIAVPTLSETSIFLPAETLKPFSSAEELNKRVTAAIDEASRAVIENSPSAQALSEETLVRESVEPLVNVVTVAENRATPTESVSLSLENNYQQTSTVQPITSPDDSPVPFIGANDDAVLAKSDKDIKENTTEASNTSYEYNRYRLVKSFIHKKTLVTLSLAKDAAQLSHK